MRRAKRYSLFLLLGLGAGIAGAAGPSLEMRAGLQSETGGSSLLDERTAAGRQALQLEPVFAWQWTRARWTSDVYLAPTLDLPARREDSGLSGMSGAWRLRFAPHQRLLLTGRLRLVRVDFEEGGSWRARSRQAGELEGRARLLAGFRASFGYEFARSRYTPAPLPEVENGVPKAAMPVGDKPDVPGRGPPDWVQERKEEREQARAESPEPEPVDPGDSVGPPSEELPNEAPADPLGASARRERRHSVRTGLTWIRGPLWLAGRATLTRNRSSAPGYEYDGLQLGVWTDLQGGRWDLTVQNSSEWRRYENGDGSRSVWRFLRLGGEIIYRLTRWLDFFVAAHREYGYREGMRAFSPWTFASAGVQLHFPLHVASSRIEDQYDPLEPRPTEQGWIFRFEDSEARSVHLIGTFCDWDPQARPLRRLADGVWEIALALGPGTYEYAFLVDGEEWVSPPQAPLYLEDGFGNRNGVLMVEEESYGPE
jgi:hypothetical protein